MIIRKGSVGESVKEIQKILGLKVDGVFGPNTENAVKEYQKKNGLVADGIVGSKTYARMVSFTTGDYPFLDNDGILSDLGDYITLEGLKIHKRYLDSNQFVSDQGPTIKNTLFIHHTAGRGNPFKTIKNWNLDDRGRIATQYCIGRTKIDGDCENNGVVVEAFPDQFFGWHLGRVGSTAMHKESIGIEINNWGWLTKKNGKFYNYVDLEMPEDQVEDLGKDFLGYRYYQKYTNEQIKSLGLLIKEIKRRHPLISLDKGLRDWLNKENSFDAFGYKSDAYYGKIKGVLSHTNVRKDKTDCYPHPQLVKLLKNI